MSHLWIKDPGGAWGIHPLEDDLFQLAARAATAITPEQLGAVNGALLMRSESEHGLERWMLLCAPHERVRINGMLVTVGIRALADGDAISLVTDRERQTLFLSLERSAEIVPFPGNDDGTCCIRCKLPLAPDAETVRCPGRDCGFWHHQTSAQPCWTYTDGCANCGHPTAFDAGFQWTPEAL